MGSITIPHDLIERVLLNRKYQYISTHKNDNTYSIYVYHIARGRGYIGRSSRSHAHALLDLIKKYKQDTHDSK